MHRLRCSCIFTYSFHILHIDSGWWEEKYLYIFRSESDFKVITKNVTVIVIDPWRSPFWLCPYSSNVYNDCFFQSSFPYTSFLTGLSVCTALISGIMWFSHRRNAKKIVWASEATAQRCFSDIRYMYLTFHKIIRAIYWQRFQHSTKNNV